jgi:hypothetical protein
MYRNIRLRIAAALAAIVCLLFSQLAVAAYICPPLRHSVATETVLQAADRGGNGDDLCAALCLAHCNPAESSLNHPQADAPPVLLVALHPLAAPCEPDVRVLTAPQLEVPIRSHSPPFSILHCCFRI